MNLTRWIECARTGRWTAMNGQPVDLTSADFDRIAAGFKPDDPDGSPLVFGHPHTDDPAYGWTAGVRGMATGGWCNSVHAGHRAQCGGRRPLPQRLVKLSPDKSR